MLSEYPGVGWRLRAQKVQVLTAIEYIHGNLGQRGNGRASIVLQPGLLRCTFIEADVYKMTTCQ